MCFDKLQLNVSFYCWHTFLSRKRLIKTIRIILILGKTAHKQAETIATIFCMKMFQVAHCLQNACSKNYMKYIIILIDQKKVMMMLSCLYYKENYYKYFHMSKF